MPPPPPHLDPWGFGTYLRRFPEHSMPRTEYGWRAWLIGSVSVACLITAACVLSVVFGPVTP